MDRAVDSLASKMLLKPGRIGGLQHKTKRQQIVGWRIDHSEPIAATKSFIQSDRVGKSYRTNQIYV
jgi:hypothetical protein